MTSRNFRRNILDDIRDRRLGKVRSPRTRTTRTRFEPSLQTNLSKQPKLSRRLRAAKLKPALKKTKTIPAKIVTKNENNIASTIGKAIVIILILAALIWGGYFLYKKFTKKSNGTKDLLNYSVPANKPFVIKNKKIPKSKYGNEYTISYWFYVNDWEFKNKQPKSVLFRGDKGAIATNPGFWFFPEDNRLKIAFQLQSFQPTFAQLDLLEDCPNSMNPIDNPNFLSDHKGTCNVKDVPLQRWNHICVSIWNQSVDVYLNGKLVRSCVMHEYPVPSSGDIHIGHKDGFNGYISSVKYYPTILTPEEVYNIYTIGPKIEKKDIEVESDSEYSVVASSL